MGKGEGDRPEAHDRIAGLEEQIAALGRRVAALEEQRGPTPPRPVSAATAGFDATAFMQRCSGPPYEEGTVRGALTYMGFAQFAEKRYLVRREAPLPALFAADPAPLAQLFAALASPHRLIVLRTLCAGPRTSQQLQEVLGMSSPGQLYHHLKELLAAGLIVQQGRSGYAIAPRSVIALCMALMAASDLLVPGTGGDQMTTRGGEEEPAEQE
jgi:DNA-binding transcriptional ArsR family regulator